jgi:hypothetical protein
LADNHTFVVHTLNLAQGVPCGGEKCLEGTRGLWGCVRQERGHQNCDDGDLYGEQTSIVHGILGSLQLHIGVPISERFKLDYLENRLINAGD